MFERDASFWQQQLAGLAHSDRQPLVPRKSLLKDANSQCLPAAHVYQQALDANDYADLEQRAKALGLSSFNVLLATMALYFWRLGAQPRVLIGVPSLNRSGQRFRQTLGMFTGLQCVLLDLELAGTAFGLLHKPVPRCRLRCAMRVTRSASWLMPCRACI